MKFFNSLINWKDLEKEIIQNALYQTKGSVKKTSEITGISQRKIHYRLKRWNKKPSDFVETPSKNQSEIEKEILQILEEWKKGELDAIETAEKICFAFKK